MIALPETQPAAVAAPSAPFFEPGDPRAGPFSPAEIKEARYYAEGAGRWHKQNHMVDWYAVRLQYGRGMPLAHVADLFGISERRIYRLRIRDNWSPRMTERDRRWLSRLVWLAGAARIPEHDHDSRRMLAAASDWRLITKPEPITWQPMDPAGEALPMKLSLLDV